MRFRDSGVVVAAMGLLVLAFAACKPAVPTTDGAPKAEQPLRIAGPNHLAQLFVAAMRSGDADGLARLCRDDIAAFYTALARIGELNGRLAATLVRLHPDRNEGEQRRMAQLRDGWKRPMLAFRELELDGRLRTELDGGRVVYQLSHLNVHSRPTYPELIVERHDQRWAVVSFGPSTPQSAHLGAIRNRLSRLEMRWEAAIAAVEAERPRTLTRSLKLLGEALSSSTTVETGDGGGGAR